MEDGSTKTKLKVINPSNEEVRCNTLASQEDDLAEAAALFL